MNGARPVGSITVEIVEPERVERITTLIGGSSLDRNHVDVAVHDNRFIDLHVETLGRVFRISVDELTRKALAEVAAYLAIEDGSRG